MEAKKLLHDKGLVIGVREIGNPLQDIWMS